MHSASALTLELSPSPRLAGAFVFIHVLAGAGLALAALPFWLPLAGSLLLMASAAHGLRRYALLRAPQSVVQLKTRADGSVDGLTRDGEWLKLRLLPDSRLFPLFAVLCFQAAGGRRRHLPIFFDALSAEDWRSFCVWLRWAAADSLGATAS